MECSEDSLIVWFGDFDREHVRIAGGKGASLSDMVNAGLPVPSGFVVCTGAFREFLMHTGLEAEILATLASLDVEDKAALDRVSQEVASKIEAQEPPPAVRQAIIEAYQQLCEECMAVAVVAVRSSAAAEDSKAASFAGQQETYLNIFGEQNVIQQVRACWGSFFSPRALFYRKLKGSLEDTSIAVVVQRMVNPEKSGVMFTIDPVQRNRHRVMIEAAWGLGESVVSGSITPDNYIVGKQDKRLVSKFVPDKPFMIVRQENGVGVRQVTLPPEKAGQQVLCTAELRQLADLAITIEAHFGCAQDVEWAIENDRLYVLQSRPVTTV